MNGTKKWITFGQIADLFLVFAQSKGSHVALLVERNSPGLSIRPISGMLGVRASMLAQLHFEDCRVSKENIVGRAGFGFSHVAASALDLGRYSNERRQSGTPIKDFQLIQAMITEMIVNVKAARLLCYQAKRGKK